MILLLGASGYVGQAFVRYLMANLIPYRALARHEIDYTHFETLVEFLRLHKPEFLINAAGYTGKPNVDACETHKTEVLLANSLLPQTIAIACGETGTPWGHISSGCIYSGAKVHSQGKIVIERDLSNPALRRQFDMNPASIYGMSESDMPNFTFRLPPCSFYSGSKALGEEVIGLQRKCYIWRLRMPFNELDGPRNYLSKMQRYEKLYDGINSLSHIDDFAGACIRLWQRRADFGTYNITNPGAITGRLVSTMIETILKPKRRVEFWKSDEEFYRVAAKAPRSNCILDVTKLSDAGISMRPVEEAVRNALEDWVSEGE